MIQRLQRPRTRDESGFTLIELLVVIAILGILAGVVVFAVGGIGDKGQDSACRIDKRTLATAEEAYASQKGGLYVPQTTTDDPGTTPGDLVPDFLSAPPKYHVVTTPADRKSFTVDPANGSPCPA